MPVKSLNVNDVVLLSSSTQIGVVKFIGPLAGKQDQVYVGIEIEEGNGDCNGSYQGVQYFKCAENKGMFVEITDIKKKLAAHLILQQMYGLSKKNRAQRAIISELRDKLELSDQKVGVNMSKTQGSSREEVQGPASWLANECTKKWWVGFDDFKYRYRETKDYSGKDLTKQLKESKHEAWIRFIKNTSPNWIRLQRMLAILVLCTLCVLLQETIF